MFMPHASKKMRDELNRTECTSHLHSLVMFNVLNHLEISDYHQINTYSVRLILVLVE